MPRFDSAFEGRSPSARLRLIGVLCAILLAVPWPGASLRAQQTAYGRDGVHIEPYAGAYVPNEPDFQSGETGFRLDAGRVTFGMRISYAFRNNLFLEASGGYVPLRFETTNGLRNANTSIVTGVLGYNFQVLPTLRAFLLAGGGLTQWLPTGMPSDEALEGVFGGGLRVFLTPGLTLGAQVRDHIISDAWTDVRGSLNPALGLEKKLTHNFEITASIGVFLGVQRDSDRDRVFDRYDACPGTPPGVRADAYGCALDADMDRVADDMDRCPGTPAGIPVGRDGCPLDSDHDGVADDADACPATPADAQVDSEGCPTDGDGDGVFSGIDRCPNTPSGAAVDDVGCPLDGDSDGVPDGLDRCPNTPPGREVDENGCTLIEAGLEKGRLVLTSIYFETNSARLRPESQAVLDDVGRALLDRPGARVEIQGHTDSTGPAAYNLKLSTARARAVLEYLIRRFPAVDQSRFVVKGYGELRPVAPNDTEAGRSKNRRVEFVLLESR